MTDFTNESSPTLPMKIQICCERLAEKTDTFLFFAKPFLYDSSILFISFATTCRIGVFVRDEHKDGLSS